MNIDTISQQLAQVIPDGYFWYTLSLLLAIALIGIIWKFAGNVSKTLEELKTITKLHEYRHDETDNKIDRIEETIFTVRYNKGK